MINYISNLIQLTKPSIMFLVVTSGATALIIEGSMLSDPLLFLIFLFGLFLTGGSANALNQYFERDLDARMERTSARRPLPTKKISSKAALIFALGIGVAGIIILWYSFNMLTAMLSLGTILFYGLFYTLWLKPNTSYNIVIGGIAGAMAPIGAWTAATNSITIMPCLLFLIIFFWTPPHFWSLALYFKNDYIKTKLPMLPVVSGDNATYDQIFYYTLILVAFSLAPLLVEFGWIYLIVSSGLGGVFIQKAYRARKLKDINIAWGVFKFSLIYLFLIFAALIIDSVL